MGAYRRDIDGLRGLAVLAVVLFHAGVPGFAGGFIGVDIFLVISGYLITGVILRDADAGDFTLAGFYERRVRRIMPALLAMLAASGVAAWIMLPGDFKQFGASLASISAFLSNFFFARGSGYFHLTESATPLLHTWSLAVEEQFYLLFPMLLLVARRTGRRGTQVALAAAALMSFAYSAWSSHANPAMAFYSPASRAWEFLAGSLLVFGPASGLASGVARMPARRGVGDGAALVGLALLGYALRRLNADMPFPGLNALAPVLGTLLLLYGGAARGSLVARALGNRPLVAVGLISYSLYLWHWPLIVFGGYYVLDEHALRLMRVAMAALAFPVAWLSWRFVERPFRGPGALLSRRSLFAGAAAASLALATYGALIYAANGIPSRFSPLVQRMSARGDAPDYGCSGRPIERLTTDIGCRIGDPAAQPSFVLWGDSHAAMLVPALRQLARAHRVSGYEITAVGCPPLYLAQTPDGQLRAAQRRGKGAAERRQRLDACGARNARVVEFIAHHRPRAVLIAGHWFAYASGKHENAEAYDRESFERAVRGLRDQGAMVYVVLDVPQAASLSTDQLARARVIGATASIEPGTADYLRLNQAMRTQMFDLQRRGLIQVIEPARLLCDPIRCHMTAGDYPLYFDSNHLNARGAHFVGRLFEPMLRALARDSGAAAPLTP